MLALNTTDLDQPNWSILQAQLRDAHGDLRRAIAVLDAITLEPVPARERLALFRLNISRAILQRRVLWGKIYSLLVREADKSVSADVRRLQETESALCRASSEHVGRWSTDTALANWSEYCIASREIRWQMASAIETERRVLFPLLDGRKPRPDIGGADEGIRHFQN